MADRWLVIGGGFRGIIGSYLLASRGKQVTLIEAGKGLGGALRSIEWRDFVLDTGCHLFDNQDDTITSIMMELLGEHYEPVYVRYASIINREQTDGIAIPNLASFGEEASQKILYELVHAAAGDNRECHNLQEELEDRFGPTAAEYLARAVHKMYKVPPRMLDATSLRMTLFQRLKFIDDDAAMTLKASPALDERVAAASQSDPKKFYRTTATKYEFRSFYPTERGLLKFCENSEAKLRESNVDIRLRTKIINMNLNGGCSVTLENGEVITGDRVLWTSDAEKLSEMLGIDVGIGDYVHQVPMVLYYFIIHREAEGDYTYLHNFDAEDIIFRASVPGGYVQKSACPEGKSYVCCEVPTEIGSPTWENKDRLTDKVWEELKRYGVVRNGDPIEVISVAVPVTYKLPKVGYWHAVGKINEYLGDTREVIGHDQWEFSMNDQIRGLLRVLDGEE